LAVEIYYGWDIIAQELCHRSGRVGLTTTCPNARAAKLTEDELSPVKVDSSKEREQVYSLTSQYGSS
jgi:hypothetical protein